MHNLRSGEVSGKSQDKGAAKVSAKGDLLRTRNLKRYINNVSVINSYLGSEKDNIVIVTVLSICNKRRNFYHRLYALIVD